MAHEEAPDAAAIAQALASADPLPAGHEAATITINDRWHLSRVSSPLPRDIPTEYPRQAPKVPGWDRVRIEEAQGRTDDAVMFLMSGGTKIVVPTDHGGIAILPIPGGLSQAAVAADPNWMLMLDALTSILGGPLTVETPVETWTHNATDD